MGGRVPSPVHSKRCGAIEERIRMSAIGEAGRPRAFHTILVGGSIAGLLDGLDAVLYYRLAFAVPPALLFQNIAAGLLGVRSFHEGWPTVGLGVALQFLIAIGAAGVYYVASLFIPALFTKPWICGPGFGLGLYFFMHYVVVPLSAVPRRTVPVPMTELVDQLFSHAMFVGLPIALMARRSAEMR
ncbi:conserved membrane hypothetical protein [Candidatus Sulfotelmatobacter sp. SbA7]|jgi:uncharacterized membrane protein YagU involved in acid resistance|nr:conserved membrane hypothetical protein [Candidatus Sulfotelmatobacter sp. SbA7]